MTIAVIGRGLVGSAAARHLAVAGHEVILIGPDEPEDWSGHAGVFASHYDEGRIARRSEATPFWGRVSAAAMDRYGQIEAESGIRFFTDCGALMAGHGPLIEKVRATRAELGTRSAELGPGELRVAFPYLSFGDRDVGFFERTGSGHISPRAMVRAQCAAAERAGAVILPHEVIGLARAETGWQVILARREVFADRVLVAAGGFTNAILPVDLPLFVYARTVALFEVDGAEATRLAPMPSYIYLQDDGRDPYFLPPIRYPDGRTYLKIGGDPVDRLVLGAAIGDWFRSGASAEVGAFLGRTLRARVPGLDAGPPVLRPCVTTFTARDRPIIDAIGEGIAVAVAGCGRGAKCSDELGRLAAMAVTGGADPLLSETRL